MHIVECLSDTRDKLGESPIWVEEENSLYWVARLNYDIISRTNLRGRDA